MKTLKIHFLNTIWSDAIILESNNHYAFVDTGSKFYYPMIEKHLFDYSIYHLDFIILTHFHSDHYGNISNIIKNFKVDKLYLKHFYGLDGNTVSIYNSNDEFIQTEFNNYYDIINTCKENNVEIIFIDDLNVNNIDILFNNITLELYDVNNIIYEVYNNPNSLYYNQKRFSENLNSIGIFIKIYDNTIFLGGDVTCSKTEVAELNLLSIKMINKIFSRYDIKKIDLYKSCHHGGSGTNTLELCSLIKPTYSIITNTARWLDTYSTYDNLKKANKDVIILPTDYQKYIFSFDENISYETIKEDSLFITLKKN